MQILYPFTKGLEYPWILISEGGGPGSILCEYQGTMINEWRGNGLENIEIEVTEQGQSSRRR